MAWLLILGCLLDICSNDPLGILGDETVAWDAPIPEDEVTYYEVRRDGMLCMTILAPATSVLVSGSACLRDRGQALLTVSACNSVGCSEPAGPVEFLTYSCLRAPGCEEECFPGAWLYLPERYSPCP